MDNVATTPALRDRLVIDALIRAGADELVLMLTIRAGADADERLTLILLDPATNMTSYLPPERARALVPKLIREMLMFNSASAEFNMIDTIVQLVKNTPEYNANPDELRNVNERNDEANDAAEARRLVFADSYWTLVDEQYDPFEEQMMEQMMEARG